MHWTEERRPEITRNLKKRSPMEFFLQNKSFNYLVVRINLRSLD